MWQRLVVGTCGTLFCGLLLACGALLNQDAIKFNDTIARANQKLERAGKSFGEHLPGAQNGNPTEVAAMKKSFEELKQTMAAVKSEIAGMKVPSKQSAKDFHTAEMNFLAVEEKIVADCAEIVRIVEDKNMNAFTKGQAIQNILTRIDNVEKAELTKLQTAQNAFARDHNIKIIK